MYYEFNSICLYCYYMLTHIIIAMNTHFNDYGCNPISNVIIPSLDCLVPL